MRLDRQREHAGVQLGPRGGVEARRRHQRAAQPLLRRTTAHPARQVLGRRAAVHAYESLPNL